MRFEIYTGRYAILSCGEGFTFNVVNKLISPYVECDHILHTDNFYTSIKLARCLRGLGTHLVGRENSKLFPKFWNQTVLPDENIKLADSMGIGGVGGLSVIGVIYIYYLQSVMGRCDGTE